MVNRAGRLALALGALLLLAHVVSRHRNRVHDEWTQRACDDWRAASRIAYLHPRAVGQENGSPLDRALAAPGVDALWDARAWLAAHPEDVPELVPFLAQPIPVRPREDPSVAGGRRTGAFCQGGYIATEEDLSTRAGRASWLLHQATGRRDEPVVPRWTNRLILADRIRSWKAWLEALDGGRACFPSR